MLWKHYHHASSFDEAAKILAEKPESARIIAGGTDLLVEKRNGFRKGVDTLIDISRIPGAGRIWMDDEKIIHLDACVTHSDCVASPLLGQYAKPLVQACHSVGSPQIRNRGTVAGNIVTASPANDAITPLMALDADVHLLSVSGKRIVPLREFYQGVRRTGMLADELVVAITFRALSVSTKSIFMKHALRNAQAISLLNCAVILNIENDSVTSAAITLGAVAPVIIHAKTAEKAIVGAKITNLDFEKIGAWASEDAAPITDIRSSGEYRSAMVKVLVKRGFQQLFEETEIIKSKPAVLWGQGTNPLHDVSLPQEIEEGTISCTVNGEHCTSPYQHGMTLLQFLRGKLDLTGSKPGCEEGECGACTMHLDGAAVLACLIPAERAQGATIVTIEGLKSEGELSPMQQAFVEEGAVQCGFCTPGFIMSATKLLEENPHPNQLEIKEAISGNLCRCTGYYKIITAIEKASQMK